jgi:hypothetical protein
LLPGKAAGFYSALAALLFDSLEASRFAIDLKGVSRDPVMPLRDLNGAKHWQERATEMHTLAEDITDVESRLLMFRLAPDYERLASRAEERGQDIDARAYPIREQRSYQ